MARFYVNVDFKKVLDKFQRMESKLANEGTVKILQEAGEFMKNEFIGMAPRDTGALQASIDYRIKENNIVEVGVQLSKAKGRVPLYSWYQEFGTHKMAANPYIRPAWESNCGTVKEMLIEKFLDLIMS